MSEPSTDAFIRRLAAETHPVRRIASPRRASLLIVLTTAAIAAVFLGPAAVVAGVWRSVSHAGLQTLVLAGLVVAATGGITSALSEREPGRDRVARVGLVTLVAGFAIAVGGAWVAATVGHTAALSWHEELRCLAKCTFLSVAPTALAFLLLTRSAPAHPRRALFAAGAGAAALGAIAVHLACAGAGEPHRLAAQGLAPLFGALITLPFAQWLARWRGEGDISYSSTS